MFRTATLALSLASALLVSTAVSAQQYGTAQQARAMLDRAVVAVRANATTALVAFNKGTDGFRDRDLYVFCATPDGTLVAHATPAMLRQNLNNLKDPTGVEFGKEILANAKEAKIGTVSYSFPRPGETKTVPKESYVTRIGGLICGVGYYK